jgi:hypothetical protein
MALPLVFTLAGCATEGEDMDFRTTSGPSSGRSVEIRLPGDFDRSEIREIAQHVEGTAKVEAAKVRVKKSDDGTNMTIELWGSDFPEEQALLADLRTRFPALGQASIQVTPLDASAAPEPLEAEIEHEDPAVVEQALRERLRSEGVDDRDASIEVTDDEFGRHVEVRVEKELDESD